MRLLHEIAIFQTVKSKLIISLFETVRLSVSISLRNLYDSLNSIKEIVYLHAVSPSCIIIIIIIIIIIDIICFSAIRYRVFSAAWTSCLTIQTQGVGINVF